MALCVFAFAACSGDEVVEPDPMDEGGRCLDPRYRDGVCQIDIPCGVPDVDCFVIFKNDLDAATWATSRTRLAPIFPSNPLFPRARAIVDRAWEMFRADVRLGDLGDMRLGMAIMDDDQVNAYVMADGEPGKMGFSVQLTKGMLLSSLSDDAIAGVVLHEITHLVHLHALISIASKTRKYYIADFGEPIGALRPENFPTRDAGRAWRRLGELNGILTDPGYGAFPTGGAFANLWDHYTWKMYDRMPECTVAVNRVQILRAHLPSSPLDEIVPVKASLTAEINETLDGVRACVSVQPYTLRELLAELGDEWVEYVMERITPAEAQYYLDAPAVDAILDLVMIRRKEQKAIEVAFEVETGSPWSKVRFYSIEEMADDFSTKIGQRHGLDELGVSSTMFALLEGAAPACRSRLATPPVPYGKNLLSEHHAPCWRIAHARQVAATLQQNAPRLRIEPLGETWTPTERETPRPLN